MKDAYSQNVWYTVKLHNLAFDQLKHQGGESQVFVWYSEQTVVFYP